MTAIKNNKTNLVTAVLMAVLILLTGSELLANNGQKNSSAKQGTGSFIPEKMIKNLEAGIQSDNEGLKRSSVYYAAYYDIEELSETLIEELKKEKDSETKILIALALYKMGNKESIKAIDNLMLYDGTEDAMTVGKAMLNLLKAKPSTTISAKQ